MRVPSIQATFGLLAISVLCLACGGPAEPPKTESVPEPVAQVSPTPTATPVPIVPVIQSAIVDEGNRTSDSPIGKFDFRNFRYPLPRGWQDSDGKEAELEDGKRPFVMTPELERIGLTFVTSKYFDATGDGQDEAVVILKIDTGGSAVPLLVYVFHWKNDEPDLLWHFRTGDRADGGLKRIFSENGEIVVELFGQDRYIVGELDTAKITGDEEQLCCPTHFTRSRYKWAGANFRLQGKRLTFLTADPDAPPIENMVEFVERQNSGKK